MKCTLKITGFLLFFLALSAFNQSYAQTTIWKFDAATNDGGMVQITSNGDGEVTKVQLGKKGDAAWTETTIQHVDDYHEYIRVKSAQTGRVYELNVDWYGGKLVKTLPEGTEHTFWLRK